MAATFESSTDANLSPEEMKDVTKDKKQVDSENLSDGKKKIPPPTFIVELKECSSRNKKKTGHKRNGKSVKKPRSSGKTSKTKTAVVDEIDERPVALNNADDLSSDSTETELENVNEDDGSSSDLENLLNILKNDKSKVKLLIEALNSDETNSTKKEEKSSKRKRKEARQNIESTPTRSKSAKSTRIITPPTPSTDRVSRSAAAALRSKFNVCNDNPLSEDNTEEKPFKRDDSDRPSNGHENESIESSSVNQRDINPSNNCDKDEKLSNDEKIVDKPKDLSTRTAIDMKICVEDTSNVKAIANSVESINSVSQNSETLLDLISQSSDVENLKIDKLKTNFIQNNSDNSVEEFLVTNNKQSLFSDFETSKLKPSISELNKVKVAEVNGDCERLTGKIEVLNINIENSGSNEIHSVSSNNCSDEVFRETEIGNHSDNLVKKSSKLVNNDQDKETDGNYTFSRVEHSLADSNASSGVLEASVVDLSSGLSSLSEDRNQTDSSNFKLDLVPAINYVENVITPDSDSSSDTGNFKRISGADEAKFSSGEEEDSVNYFDNHEIDAMPLQNLEILSETVKPIIGKDEENYYLLAAVDANEEASPLSPSESEDNCWEINSNENVTMIGKPMSNKCNISTSDDINSISIEDINSHHSSEESFTFNSDDFEVQDEDEDEEEEEESEELSLVGIPIINDYVDPDKGYHVVSGYLIGTTVKVPKCYYKNDPNPLEMVEVQDVEVEKVLTKGRWRKADISSIMGLDVTRDVLQCFCPFLFLLGCCDPGNEECAFSHSMPEAVLKKHPFNETWLVIEFILKHMASKMEITANFISSVLKLLAEKVNFTENELSDCIKKVLYLTAYIPFVSKGRSVLWKSALKVLVGKGIARWLAVQNIFKYVKVYFMEAPSKLFSLWIEMLEIFEVDKFHGKIWEIVECLVENCDFTLPLKFLTAVLIDVANYEDDYIAMLHETDQYKRPKSGPFRILTRQLLMMRNDQLPLIGQHELHVFLAKAVAEVSDLREPLSRIRNQLNLEADSSDLPRESFTESFDNFNKRSLKRSRSIPDLRDIHTPKRRIDEDEMIQPVFERDKKVASLSRALEASDLDNVVAILIDSTKKSFFPSLFEKIFNHFKKNPESPSIRDILCRLNKDTTDPNVEMVKHWVGKVILTLMLCSVKNGDWLEANTLLSLLHSFKFHPIYLEVIIGECSQVRKAVSCSEIHLHNGHFKSAIKVLINFSLFKRDNWKIQGDECDIVIVEKMTNYLFRKLIERKEYDHVIVLFNGILQELGKVTQEGAIDLTNFFEELLHGLFEETAKYAAKCIALYSSVISVDPTVTLDAVTYRTLLVLAHRLELLSVAHGIADKCVDNNIYPPIQEKERIIRLHKCFLAEEMEVYITRWFRWFIRTYGKKAVAIKLQFTDDSSEDAAMNSRFGMPKLLIQIDPSLKASVRRLLSVISDISNCDTELPTMNVRKDVVILTAEATDSVIKSMLLSEVFLFRE